MEQFEHDTDLQTWVASLASVVRRLVAESGSSDGFNAEAWTEDWLSTSCLALGGRRPIDLAGTSEGREAVAQLVAQMQSGAYA